MLKNPVEPAPGPNKKCEKLKTGDGPHGVKIKRGGPRFELFKKEKKIVRQKVWPARKWGKGIRKEPQMSEEPAPRTGNNTGRHRQSGNEDTETYQRRERGVSKKKEKKKKKPRTQRKGDPGTSINTLAAGNRTDASETMAWGPPFNRRQRKTGQANSRPTTCS